MEKKTKEKEEEEGEREMCGFELQFVSDLHIGLVCFFLLFFSSSYFPFSRIFGRRRISKN